MVGRQLRHIMRKEAGLAPRQVLRVFVPSRLDRVNGDVLGPKLDELLARTISLPSQIFIEESFVRCHGVDVASKLCNGREVMDVDVRLQTGAKRRRHSAATASKDYRDCADLK